MFGDLFLEDVRAYHEPRPAAKGIRPVFPRWRRNTRQIAHEMIRTGLGATVVSIDPRSMPRERAGRRFDERFLSDLPPAVDPCGENGEFHTFAWAGPMFAHPTTCAVGPTIERDGFVFTDVRPGVARPPSRT